MAGKKIIVLGADATTQELLVQTFSPGAFQVFTVPSRADAAFQLCHIQPDLIILDLPQPGPEEREILHRIRKLSPAPVIVLSALAVHGILVETLNDGADDFMAKPFDPREVRARAHALLRRSQSATQMALEPETVPMRSSQAAGELDSAFSKSC